MKKNRLFLLAALILSILFSSSVVLSKTSAVWVEGEVTRKPWKQQNIDYIEVDGLSYTIRPDIPVVHRYQRDPGAWDEEPSGIYAIFSGQRIMIKVMANDVIQIILL